MIIVDDEANEEIASIEEVIVVTSIVPYMRDGPDHFIDVQEEIGDYFRYTTLLLFLDALFEI